MAFLPRLPRPVRVTEPEQRRGDRRRAERRERPRAPSEPPATLPGALMDSSLFGASQLLDAPPMTGWAGGGDAVDARALAREARRVATSPGGSFDRVLRTYASARALVGLALVAAQAGQSLWAGRGPAAAVATLCVVYALQALMLWLLPSARPLMAAQQTPSARRWQWLATVGVDLIVFAALHLLDGQQGLNYAALLVLPVVMSGVLSSRLIGLGTAAAVALFLLGVAGRDVGSLSEGAAWMAQWGLAGVGLFGLVLLAGELAARLAREEMAARGSLAIARQQAQLNRLVLEEMADGVLVVDGRMRVRSSNPAARQLLASRGSLERLPESLHEEAAWLPLAERVMNALRTPDLTEAADEVRLQFDDGNERSLRVRMRFLRRRNPAPDGTPGDEGIAVLWLEDARRAQARVQQEKLAAMGRVSAGVAHEIRNPLAAIAQANALMREDALDPATARLAQMVADNVQRLQRIVDDVLEAVPGGSASSVVLDLREACLRCVADWSKTAGVAVRSDENAAAGAVLRLELPPTPLPVWFDADHLQRVLVNLLDNGLRHSTRSADALWLRVAARDDNSAVVSVASDGPPIAPDVEPHLFEPFYSTRSRGTGLGLFICRELCERHAADLAYRPRLPGERHRNSFVVVFRRATEARAPGASA